MPTANDLIYQAALKLGAIGTGEALTASESADSLSILNSMLEYMGVNPQLIYHVVQNTHSWPAATQSQTIGVGGDIDMAWPVTIEDGTYYRDVHNIDSQVVVLQDRASFDGIASKTDQTTFPLYMFYDRAYPLGTINVYPIPSTPITLFLNTWQPLQSFTIGTEALALPPGYQWMIEHNLAVHLQPVFSMPVPASVMAEANSSRRTIAQNNDIPIMPGTEVAYVLNGRGRSDIEAGV